MELSTLITGVAFACCLCVACGASQPQDDTHTKYGAAGTLAMGGSPSDAGGGAGVAGHAASGGTSSNGGNAPEGHGGASIGNGGASIGNGGASIGNGGASIGNGGASPGNGGSTSQGFAGPGTVTPPWSGFCTATLTADFAALDPLQNPLFTARKGEQYLIEYEFDAHWARLLYLTPVGPLEFDIKTDSTELPFTSNCAPTQNLSVYGVFADVSVFAEPQLVTKLCDLTAGTTVPCDSSKGRGATFDLTAGPPDIDKFFLNGFSARCNGADAGYIRAESVTVSGTRYFPAPFVAIAGR